MQQHVSLSKRENSGIGKFSKQIQPIDFFIFMNLCIASKTLQLCKLVAIWIAETVLRIAQ